jgi:hypothetical protein
MHGSAGSGRGGHTESASAFLQTAPWPAVFGVMLLSLPLGYARLRSYVEAGWCGRESVEGEAGLGWRGRRARCCARLAAADADSGGLCRSNSQSFSSSGRGARNAAWRRATCNSSSGTSQRPSAWIVKVVRIVRVLRVVRIVAGIARAEAEIAEVEA